MVYNGGLMNMIVTNKKKNITNNEKPVGQIIMDYFEEKKIENIFGVPGGAIFLMLQYLPKNVIFTGSGNELHDAFSAQQYGRDQNKVGILFTTSGPGFWNATSAILQAYRDGNPLLVITGYIDEWQSEDFQAYDVASIAKQISQYSYKINKRNMHYTDYIINNLYNFCLNNKAVCFLSIDKKIQTSIPKYLINRKEIIRDQIYNLQYYSKLLKYYLNKSKKPLLLIGSVGLYKNNINIIKAFSEINNIPIVTTSRGRGIKSDQEYNFKHYGHIGTLGKHTANYAVIQCDTLIIIGLVSGEEGDQSITYTNRLGIGILKNNKNNKKIISISPDKRFNIPQTNIHIELDNLTKILENNTTNSSYNDWNKQLENAYENLNNHDFSKKPCEYLIDEYSKIFSSVYEDKNMDYDLVLDTGNHWYSIQKYFNPNNYKNLETSIRWGHIGCSLPLAYGKYLSDKKPVYVIAGDGGIIDGLAMLSYCINQQQQNINIPITFFIYIDGYYSAVAAGYEMEGLIKKENANNLTIEKDTYLSTVQVPQVDFEKLVPNEMLTIINNPSELKDYLESNTICTTFKVVLLKINKNNDVKNIFNSTVQEINFSKKMVTALMNDDFETVINMPLVLKSETD